MDCCIIFLLLENFAKMKHVMLVQLHLLWSDKFISTRTDRHIVFKEARHFLHNELKHGKKFQFQMCVWVVAQ